MEEFHKWRKSITNDTSVVIDGKVFNEIVVAAKKTTYEKYKSLDLKKIIPKSDL